MSEIAAAVGSWHVTVYETDGPPTRGLCTLGADGTMVTAEHPVVTPPGAPGVIFTSSGHGAWKAAGPDRVIFTFATLGSDGAGNLYGVVTFRGDTTLNQEGTAFAGDIVATIADPAGTTLAVFPMTIDGTRIAAEGPETVLAESPGLAPEVGTRR
jgi:hypothetical protein